MTPLFAQSPTTAPASACTWSFDALEQGAYPAQGSSHALRVVRQAQVTPGLAGNAVQLTRLDCLAAKAFPNHLADGVFSIQFWVKVDWANRRWDHGDVLNLVTSDKQNLALWRVGFPSIETSEIPRDRWPLVLQIGEFSTREHPIWIEPMRWTHVAFVGDGQSIALFRNGGLLNHIRLPKEGLKAAAHAVGTLQVNGSFSSGSTNHYRGNWECDLRLDELKLSDSAVAPQVTYPADLATPPQTASLRARSAELTGLDEQDRTAIASLLRYAEQIDNGADTRALRELYVQRAREAIERAPSATHSRGALGGLRGHLKLSYLSKLDFSEQPYEVYVPQSLDATRPTALVVVLHGSGEDEGAQFFRYSLEQEAEKRGWIVVTPYGRGQRAYHDSGERDVLDVIAQVQRHWSIDAGRVYLTGHSMGGYGTLHVAAENPQLFAALAPVASSGRADLVSGVKDLPTLWIHGDNDGDWTATQLPKVLQAVRDLRTPHESRVMKGYDHGGVLELSWPNVVEATLPEVFDFFARHPKTPAAIAR